MTKLFFLLTLLAVIDSVVAQENFEGKISYDVIGDVDKKQRSEMLVYFKKDKVKMLIYDSSKTHPDEDNVLFDLKFNKVFNLNTVHKSFSEDTLRSNEGMVTKLLPVAGKRILLGYSCSEFKTHDTYSRKKNPDVVQMTFWYADSLFFPFDTSLRYANVLPLLSNGEGICLETEVIDATLHVPQKIVFKAKQIDRLEIPDSIFSIPPDFKNYKSWSTRYDSTLVNKDSLDKYIDSVKLQIDSAIKQLEFSKKEKGLQTHPSYRKKSHPQKPSSKNTNKQPTKTAANKPKE